MDVKIAPYREIFFADDNLADQWFKAKLSFITIDERTDKEKRTSMMYLVNAGNISSAINNIGEVMSGTMIDYVTTSISATKIFDVFEYKKKD